jgi:hypothetical protein
MKFWPGVLMPVLLLSACVTTPQPIDDYALARAAIEAAKSVEAARFSPGNWHQADEAYRKAQVYFKNQEYEEAQKEFVKARKAAEKAENSARLIRQKSGEVL